MIRKVVNYYILLMDDFPFIPGGISIMLEIHDVYCLEIQDYSRTTLLRLRGLSIPSGIQGMSPILIHQVYNSNRDEDSGP